MVTQRMHALLRSSVVRVGHALHPLSNPGHEKRGVPYAVICTCIQHEIELNYYVPSARIESTTYKYGCR